MRCFKVIRQNVGNFRLQCRLARGFLYVNFLPNAKRHKARVKIPPIAYRRLAALVSLVARVLMHAGQGAFRRGIHNYFKRYFTARKISKRYALPLIHTLIITDFITVRVNFVAVVYSAYIKVQEILFICIGRFKFSGVNPKFILHPFILFKIHFPVVIGQVILPRVIKLHCARYCRAEILLGSFICRVAIAYLPVK